MRKSDSIIATIMLAFSLWLPANAAADQSSQPLHQRIDALIGAKIKAVNHPIADRASDAEFLRRVMLDFAGEIPTAALARAFLADTSKDKRVKLIDRLLAGPRYAEHMADVFHIMLMERRGDDDAWKRYLVASFKTNKPWDQMAREMLHPRDTDKALAPAGFFITKRLEKYGQNPTDYPGLTRDVGRMFLGIDLQCAQCHNHLTVDQYKQVDFQGVFAVYQNLKLQNTAKDRPAKWVSEALMTEPVSFKSVFSGKEYQTPPRVPFGDPIAIPKLGGDAQWKVKPDRRKKILGEPAFSPLQEMAARIAHKDNPYFVRNIANRLWFYMLGRGLIEPLDLAHQENPPSHPELLQALVDELIAHRFDMKHVLREIALSETYQRSSVLPERSAGKINDSLFAVAREKHIPAEVLLRSMLIATGELDRLLDENSEELANLRKAFHDAFANAEKEPELEVSPTLKAALYLRNNDAVLKLLQPRGDNLAARLLKIKNPQALADELFLTMFSRKPDKDESAIVAAYLREFEDGEKARQHVVWSLLTSVEFCVNH